MWLPILIAFFILSESLYCQAEDPTCGIRKTKTGDDLQFKIVGGKSVNLGEFPWVVVFSAHFEYGNHRCTGSMISPKYALTAAHCTRDKWGRNITSGFIKASVIDLYDDGVVVNLKNWTHHEKYDFADDDSINDIALLELEAPINFNDSIGAICLPKTFDENGKVGLAVGFGRTWDELLGERDEQEHGKLLKVKVDFQKPEFCIGNNSNSLDIHLRNSSNQFCAGSFQKGTNYGDSGGPLMNAIETAFSDGTKKNLFFLVGLTSVGRYQNDLHRNTDKYDHGVYTRVSAFCSWIEEKTHSEVKCI